MKNNIQYETYKTKGLFPKGLAFMISMQEDKGSNLGRSNNIVIGV